MYKHKFYKAGRHQKRFEETKNESGWLWMTKIKTEGKWWTLKFQPIGPGVSY